MSERAVKDCDGCGRQQITGDPIWIKVGFQVNSADACTETTRERFDLCETCATRAFQVIGPMIDEATGHKLATLIRTWKTKFPDSGRP